MPRATALPRELQRRSDALTGDTVVNIVALPPLNLDSEAGESSDEETDELGQPGTGNVGAPMDALDTEAEDSDPDDDAENNPVRPTPQQRPVAEYEFRWRRRDPPVSDVSWGGGQVPVPPAEDEDQTPSSYLKEYLDEELFEYLAEQTNLYSTQVTGTSINTNAQEIKTFVSIHILMGCVDLPRYEMYWSTSVSFDSVRSKMPLKRFKTLRRFFHINDNTNLPDRTDPNRDRLFKIRPLLDRLLPKFRAAPNEEKQSIDEQMIPFKGRSYMKQYIKNKPKSWGFKSFNRCGVSGFTYDLIIYDGSKIPDPNNLGVTGAIVDRLCAEVPKGLNYKLYFDNYYTSPKLMLHLSRQGIPCLGTIRGNRMAGAQALLKNEKEMKQMKRGGTNAVCDANSGISIVQWLDNNVVKVCSTFVATEPVDTARRWDGAAKQHVEVERPAVVREYNEHMGGVDLSDMLISLYRTPMRSRRWYLRLAFHLFDICIVNAWILYRRDVIHFWALDRKPGKPKYLSLLEFRFEVAEGILAGPRSDSASRPRGRPRIIIAPPTPPIGAEVEVLAENEPGTSDEPTAKRRQRVTDPIPDLRFDGLDHWPTKTNDRRHCRMCKKAQSRIMCTKCSVNLCVGTCYALYHSQ